MHNTGDEVKKVEDVSVWQTFRGNEWENKGEAVSVKELDAEGLHTVWGFELKCVGGKEYLIQRQGCKYLPSSCWKLEKSP